MSASGLRVLAKARVGGFWYKEVNARRGVLPLARRGLHCRNDVRNMAEVMQQRI